MLTLGTIKEDILVAYDSWVIRGGYELVKNNTGQRIQRNKRMCL